MQVQEGGCQHEERHGRLRRRCVAQVLVADAHRLLQDAIAVPVAVADLGVVPLGAVAAGVDPALVALLHQRLWLGKLLRVLLENTGQWRVNAMSVFCYRIPQKTIPCAALLSREHTTKQS